MTKELVLNTFAGDIPIVNLQGYILDHVPRIKMEYPDKVKVFDKRNLACSVGEDLNKVNEPQIIEYSLKEYPAIKIDHRLYLNSESRFDSERYVEQSIENMIYRSAKEKIFSVVSKTTPEFYKEDLDMESLHDLVEKLAEKFASGNLIGVFTELSKNQRFFTIMEKDTFKQYVSLIQCPASIKEAPGLVIRPFTELIQMKDTLVTGRVRDYRHLYEEFRNKAIF